MGGWWGLFVPLPTAPLSHNPSVCGTSLQSAPRLPSRWRQRKPILLEPLSGRACEAAAFGGPVSLRPGAIAHTRLTGATLRRLLSVPSSSTTAVAAAAASPRIVDQELHCPVLYATSAAPCACVPACVSTYVYVRL